MDASAKRAKLQEIVEAAVDAAIAQSGRSVPFVLGQRRVIPCYMLYGPSMPPFWVCSKRALDPNGAKQWLNKALYYEYIEYPKHWQGPPQVRVDDSWGTVLDWLKVHVLPESRGTVYTDDK